MIDSLKCDDFRKQLNTTFQITDVADGPAITLIEVTERNDSPRLDQFSLIFRGPVSHGLIQRSYAMAHQALGNLMLFLVPLGPDEGMMRYQAVVNRIRK
jgi:hypothetical protein